MSKKGKEEEKEEEERVKKLIKQLKDKDKWVRLRAASALREIGEKAAEQGAVPALIEALKKDGNSTVRLKAAEALGKMGTKAAEAVPALIKALKKDKDEWVRQKAAEALGRMGEKAEAAVPALVEVLKKDEDEWVRQRAAEALGRIDEKHPLKKRVLQLTDFAEGSRCMVSHLEIHLEMDELVACPFCAGLAKKELLEEWLDEKGICPVCRRKLRIEDCPKVVLKELIS